jgi:hypothetical protein
MANPRALIKQADLTRIVKALQAAGVDEWTAEIDPSGKVALSVGKAALAPRKSDWD